MLRNYYKKFGNMYSLLIQDMRAEVTNAFAESYKKEIIICIFLPMVVL